MVTIEIKNIGPIKEVKFDLNKINVFMGPQSSGKSTIAKICSQCLWFEKNYILTGDEYYFYKGLIDFHKMDKNYFSKDSEIKYESQWTVLNFKNKETIIELKDNNNCIYQNLKIEYIPAERNFVSAIPNLQRYSDSFNHIINFLNDWMLFKEVLTKDKKYSSPLRSVNTKYKYDTATKEDLITLPNRKTIQLQSSSSGQQSITPLLLVCDYMYKELYTQKRNPSPAEKKHISDLLPESMKEDYNWVVDMQNFQQSDKHAQNINTIENVKKKIWDKIGFSTDYHFSSVIVEEPEQNLFPETQKELMYYLLELVLQKGHNHTLFITTHSPYILYALNNCMMGGLVTSQLKDKKEKTEFIGNKFLSEKSWINPQSDRKSTRLNSSH